MKVLGILILTFAATAGFAQNLKSTASCDMSLNIVSEDGNNGLGVTYDTKSKRYYTAFAGNDSYPLEAFNSDGEFIFSTQLGIDARGFWYNPSSKSLEGIGYENTNSYSIPVDATLGTTLNANPTVKATESYGMETQQVGVYCGKKGLLFVQNGSAYFFKKTGADAKVVTLQLNSAQESLNQISPIYTGVKGKEIGLFNYEDMTVEFYSAADGKYAGNVMLDYNSCIEEIDIPYSFRFAYANNKVWLYDTYSRSWLGFSVWN